MQTLTITRRNHTFVWQSTDDQFFTLVDSNITLTVYHDGSCVLHDGFGTLWTGSSPEHAVDWLVHDCDCAACSGQLDTLLAVDYAIVDCYHLGSTKQVISLPSGISSAMIYHLCLNLIDTIVFDRQYGEITMYAGNTNYRVSLQFMPDQYNSAIKTICYWFTITDITNAVLTTKESTQ